MLKDVPYSTLKQDGRAYEIMLLHDQHGNTFADISKGYEISVVRVIQLYNKLKMKQARLYINHITVSLGLESTTQIKAVYNAAYEFYQRRSYACAYLEQIYSDILTEYRDGEPGLSAQMIKKMPPFIAQLSEQAVLRVVEMREVEKASFITIGEELHLTQEKAKQVYDSFYHKQVTKLIAALQEKAVSREEKDAIFNCYFGKRYSSKTRYDMLTKE